MTAVFCRFSVPAQAIRSSRDSVAEIFTIEFVLDAGNALLVTHVNCDGLGATNCCAGLGVRNANRWGSWFCGALTGQCIDNIGDQRTEAIVGSCRSSGFGRHDGGGGKEEQKSCRDAEGELT